MFIKEKKLFFTTAQVILDDAKALELSQNNIYNRLIVISHEKLNLPNFSVQEKTTGLIDLEKNENDILLSFSKTTRNEINKTLKDEKFKVVKSDKVTDIGYEVYKKFEHKAFRKPFKRKTFLGVSEILVTYNDNVLAGVFYYPNLPISRIKSIFSLRKDIVDKEEYNRVGFASRRAIFEACKEAKNLGSRALDLASVKKEDSMITDKVKLGINNFKLSFNPVIVPDYIYSFRTVTYSFFEKLISLFK